MKLKTSRLETLSDGIVAIVMTIMLLNFIEVFNFAKPLREKDFFLLCYNLRHDFISYVISFLVLGLLWFEHHQQFHFIKYTDAVLTFLNILWFMFISLVPFSTVLMGDYEKFIAPVIFFEWNILISSMILYIHWIYATQQNRLVDLGLDTAIIRRHKKVNLFLAIICGLAICLAFINRALSLFFFSVFSFLMIFIKWPYLW